MVHHPFRVLYFCYFSEKINQYFYTSKTYISILTLLNKILTSYKHQYNGGYDKREIL